MNEFENKTIIYKIKKRERACSMRGRGRHGALGSERGGGVRIRGSGRGRAAPRSAEKARSDEEKRAPEPQRAFLWCVPLAMTWGTNADT